MTTPINTRLLNACRAALADRYANRPESRVAGMLRAAIADAERAVAPVPTNIGVPAGPVAGCGCVACAEDRAEQPRDVDGSPICTCTNGKLCPLHREVPVCSFGQGDFRRDLTAGELIDRTA